MNFISARGNRITTTLCAICAFALIGQVKACFASTPGSAPARPASSARAEGAIREIRAVTTLPGRDGSKIRVSASISGAPSNAASDRRIGINLDLMTGRADESGGQGFIDYDQAKTMISALSIMQQTVEQAASAPEEQASFHFSTRRGIEIGFVQSGDKITAYIAVNHRRHAFDVKTVSDLRYAIQHATDTLKSEQPVVTSLAAR